MGTGEPGEGTQQRQPFSKIQMGSVGLAERRVSLPSWGLLQGQRQRWVQVKGPHTYSAMAHCKKSGQTFLPALNWRERPMGGIPRALQSPQWDQESPVVEKLGSRCAASWNLQTRVTSGPPRGSKATELGGVGLLTWRETSSGVDQGRSPATPASATLGHGPQTAKPVPEPGGRSPAAHIWQKLAKSQSWLGAKGRISQATVLTRPCFLMTSFLLIK